MKRATVMRKLVLALLILMIPLVVAEAQNPFSWLEDSIKGLTEAAIELLDVLKSSALMIARALSGTLIALGLVLWGTDIFGYKGKRLIIAGVVMLFIVEMI
jgi:hypothetical protein